MKLDPILQEELHSYLPKSDILFITRAKLYVYNEGEAIWTYNCEGFFLLLRDRRTDIVTLVMLHAINFEVFFQMEHYSNFMNYCKMFLDAQFFLFLVPTNYIPLKFGLCLDSRDELQELKKAVDKIEFRDHVSKLAPEKNDILIKQDEIIDLPESQKLLRKAGVENDKLQTDLLFRQNVTNILNEFMKKDNRQEENHISRFRALALDQVHLEHAAGYTMEKEKEDLALKKLVQEVRQEKIRNKY